VDGISVIIPLYNKAAHVGRALESALCQDFHDTEIIVVDDGSVDEGPAVVRSYRDKRLRMIRQANSGPGAARNRGVAESRHPYIAFLDADDEWLDGFLRTSMENLLRHPDCALSITGHYVGEDKRLWPGLEILQVSKGPWRLHSDISPRIMGASLAFIHSAGAVLCRREVVSRFGGFYEKACVYGEDLYLWLQVMLNCRIFREPAPLFWQHTESSELARAGRAIRRHDPVLPFLTCPGPVRASCPPEHKNLLEKYLAYEALCCAHECSSEGNTAIARRLVKDYPLMSCYVWQYAKLRYKIAFPATIPLLQTSKRAMHAAAMVFTS